MTVVESTDADLVARCQTSDVDAFEELYRRQASRIYALACRMAGSPEAGEDLLQEIFLQAFRKIGSFKGDATIGTWLYRLAVKHCLDFVLHDVEGYDHKEVAEMLGIAEGTSKSQVFKARMKLRALLQARTIART